MIVLSVASDPEPNPDFAVTYCQRAVAETNTDREDRTGWMNLLELEARMVGVTEKRPISLAGPVLGVSGERCE